MVGLRVDIKDITFMYIMMLLAIFPGQYILIFTGKRGLQMEKAILAQQQGATYHRIRMILRSR